MATFFNQATLSYNDTVTSSNIVTGELVEVLSVTKTAVPSEYRVGDTVTYLVNLVNAGGVSYSDLTVTDDLGAYPFGEGQVVPLAYREQTVRYFVNGVLQSPPTIEAGPPLSVTGLDVPAGGNALLVYTVTVNAFAPSEAEGSIVNTVTVSGGGLTTALSASETITAAEGALLDITKAISPSVVVGSGPLTYTFVIRNVGNEAATAEDNVSVSDTFDPILDIQRVTLDGEVLSEGEDYTYDESTGVFTTVPGRITVPAATYVQDPETGEFAVTPGVVTLTVTGTV